MASYDNLTSIEPWIFRSTFADSWISDAFAQDSETLTRALRKSLAAADHESFLSESFSPFVDIVKPDTAPTPTVSGLSVGSEPEVTPKRQKNPIPASGCKVSKRKPRASKRSQTTFITADPANFRQMVQQVTGVRFGNSEVSVTVPIVKPEPQRAVGWLAGGGYLPTLDTSAFLLDRHNQKQVVGPNLTSGLGSGLTGPGPLSHEPMPVGVSDGAPAAGFDFGTFSSFPTLESCDY